MAVSAEEKAHRLLVEGRLVIQEVRPPNGKIVATCRGLTSGETHSLGFDPRGVGMWRCTCQASRDFGRRCSHLIALQLVTSRSKA